MRLPLWGVLVSTAVWAAPADLPRPKTPRELYRDHADSVVLVFASHGTGKASAGSGFIVDDEGLVLTNAHVVAIDGRPYPRLYVYLKPDQLTGSSSRDLRRRLPVKLVDLDRDLDIALLRIQEATPGLKALRLADPGDVHIGEPVVALGHPETGGLWTLTTGTISSVVADFGGVEGKDVFQTEASVNRGNSGGPLIDAYGHVVGINSSISRKGPNGNVITDVNFSLKSSVAKRWLEERGHLRLRYASRREASPAGGEAEPPEELPPMVDVAEDPDFQDRARAMQDAPQKPLPPAPSKQLTPSRPFGWDAFLEARSREVQELEDLMEDAKRNIQRKSGTQSRNPPGLELW